VAKIALCLHRERPVAAQAAADLALWLEGEGHLPVMPLEDAEFAGRPDLGVADAVIGQGTDLALSFGGDGNMLRTVRLVADDDVPVLGVNFGQLGYLSEVEPAGLHGAVLRFLAGDYVVEERLRLEIVLEGNGVVHRALNEAVVEKVESGKVIRLGVYFNDDFFTTYATDGLIMATPTGSTAYSFSARGPIIDPTHRCLVLTPVAPHMLFDRTMVLSPDDEIRIDVLPDRHAALAIDGRIVVRCDVGASVRCRAAAHPARLINLGGRDFHGLLKAKFQLNDR
jgi:NAD+ kinase